MLNERTKLLHELDKRVTCGQFFTFVIGSGSSAMRAEPTLKLHSTKLVIDKNKLSMDFKLG